MITKEVRGLLASIPLDREEVDAIVEHRGVDRKTARIAYRLANVDHVDLAELMLKK